MFNVFNIAWGKSPHSTFHYTTDIHLLALMLLAFTMRRMVRSAHLALSPKHFTAQFDFAVSNRHTASLGTARWADLSTRHHIKPWPKGSGLMWWLVLSWAHLAFPTMPYAYNIAGSQNKRISIPCKPVILYALIWKWSWNLTQYVFRHHVDMKRYLIGQLLSFIIPVVFFSNVLKKEIHIRQLRLCFWSSGFVCLFHRRITHKVMICIW